MRRNLLLLGCGLAWLTGTLAAPDARQYPCYQLPAAPVIDGRLDDACWRAVPEATGFFRLGRPGYAVRKPTTFRIGWTADALYLAARCREPFTTRLKALTADGDDLWSDDSLELFLAPAGPGYQQFIANSVGARWQGTSAGAAATLGPWQAAAQVTAEGWTLELRLPFSVVGRTPRTGDSWAFNLGRNMTTTPAAELHTAWAPVKRAFAEVPNFARLTFATAPAGPVAAVEQQLGAAYAEFLRQPPEGPANQLANADFAAGLGSWGLREPTRISLDPTISTTGGRSVKLDGSGRSDLFVNAMQGLKLKPATRYILRCDLRRSKFSSGTISVDVLERDRKEVEWTYHRCGERPDKTDQPLAWGHYELRFQTSEHLLEAMLMLYNISSGATAWYDGLELVEDDGSSPTGATLASTTLRFDLQTRDATAKLLVNGQPVEAVPGQPLTAPIREGLTVIGVQAEAQGPHPGVRLTLPGRPETDGRWRLSGATAGAWTAAEFDDRAWPVAITDAQGFLWPTGAKTMAARQVVLWNQGHDGPERCFNPLVKEWGISEGSAETLFFQPYSLFPYPLDEFELVFDMPRDCRLLDIMHDTGRHILNCRPTSVTSAAVTHAGRAFTRYRIAFPKQHVPANDSIRNLLLPVFLEHWTSPQKSTAWYYHRQAKGNFTELEQAIPVRVLPPINGRLPRQVRISQYCAIPWAYGQVSSEHLAQHLKQSFAAGFNTWIFGRYNVAGDPYLKTMQDQVLAAKGQIILWTNYPYYGLKENVYTGDPNATDAGRQWLQDHPAARARYFDGQGTWEKRLQYCPTYATGPGRASFLALVKETYRRKAAALTGATVIWSDWEESPWNSGSIYDSPRDGHDSWCFCDQCKAEFRQWAKLPADADLSDQNLFKTYKQPWAAFRSELDARVAAVNRQASEELGKPYLIYSWTAHQRYWAALKGRLTQAFPGCPGNGAADGQQQQHLDDTMNFFRDQVGLGRSQVMGQRFSFFYYYDLAHPQQFWRKWEVMSPSGYLEPQSWKTQILRCVASFGLGVDVQSSLECSAGMLYWIGEATRIVATYEDLFHDGERDDRLASCDQLEYPNVLVLKKGRERLVLLFNEGARPLTVTLHNQDLAAGQTAQVDGSAQRVAQPASMAVTVPAGDVAVVHVQ